MKDKILLRNRPKTRAAVLTVFLLGVATLIYGVGVVPREMHEVRHDITVQGWPSTCDGTRLDFVSDTHTGSVSNGIENLDRLVTKLEASDAEIIVLGGDYVILKVFGGTFVSGAEVAKHLEKLTRTKTVYAVLGNHDWWKGGLQIAADLGAAGVKVIDNRAVKITQGSCSFWLAGFGDHDEGHPDIPYTMAQTKQDASLPVIALAHNPHEFQQIPANVGLMLSGHTHGGQIKLPFATYPAFWLKKHPESTYIDGLYRNEKTGQQLFVTRGIGTSIFPLRIGVPPEISQLTIKSAQK